MSCHERWIINTYLAVCEPDFSVTTLIPFPRVELSIHIKPIIINKHSKIEWRKNRKTRLTHGAVVLEGFGDLSAGQVTEVRHRGRS